MEQTYKVRVTGLWDLVSKVTAIMPEGLHGAEALNWIWERVKVDNPQVSRKQVRDAIYHLGVKNRLEADSEEGMSAHTPAHTPAPAVPQEPELSGTENTRAAGSSATARIGTESGALPAEGELPISVIQSLTAVLDSAALQTLRADTVQMREFFHGYLMGANTVMGILCGAMGVDTSFLGVPGVQGPAQAPSGSEGEQKA